MQENLRQGVVVERSRKPEVDSQIGRPGSLSFKELRRRRREQQREKTAALAAAMGTLPDSRRTAKLWSRKRRGIKDQAFPSEHNPVPGLIAAQRKLHHKADVAEALSDLWKTNDTDDTYPGPNNWYDAVAQMDEHDLPDEYDNLWPAEEWEQEFDDDRFDWEAGDTYPYSLESLDYHENEGEYSEVSGETVDDSSVDRLRRPNLGKKRRERLQRKRLSSRYFHRGTTKDSVLRADNSPRERRRWEREMSGKKDRKTGMKSVDGGAITHKDMTPDEKAIARLNRKRGVEINNLNQPIENHGSKDITRRRKHQRLHLESEVRNALLAHHEGEYTEEDSRKLGQLTSDDRSYLDEFEREEDERADAWADWQAGDRFGGAKERDHENYDPNFDLLSATPKEITQQLLEGKLDFTSIPIPLRDGIVGELTRLYNKHLIPKKQWNTLDADLQYEIIQKRAQHLNFYHGPLGRKQRVQHVRGAVDKRL